VKIGEEYVMKYAIIDIGGKQYKAVEGSKIDVDLLALEVEQAYKIDSVLLLVDGDNISVGSPLVEKTSVSAKVVDHIKGPKIIVFKYKPKKRIRVKTGHRQKYTRLLIEKIEVEK
jgi:large subunit ribosomal protein L21